MIDTNGVFHISEVEYHSDPAVFPSLSSSLARAILRSPLHAWTASRRLNPNYKAKEKPAFDLGRAFHTLMLGTGAPIAVINADNWTTKLAREARDAARAAGQTPMLQAQCDALEEMVDAVRPQLERFGIELDGDRNEVAAFAKAEVDGCWCRALVDHAPADVRRPLIDLKTTTDASYEACINSITRYGYDIQAAHYLDTWLAATGEEREFWFVFVEVDPPYGVQVIKLHQGDDDADWWTKAYEDVRLARRLWVRCLETDTWPGYPAAVVEVGSPVWYTQRWERRPTWFEEDAA